MIEKQSLARRIWKYRLHYLIVIPALIFLFIFKGIPFLYALFLPFRDVNLFAGFIGSPWVGWSNFSQMFGSPIFITALTNTLAIKGMYILVAGLIALIVSLALSGIRSAKWRYAYATLFLVPYFIPSAILAFLAAIVLSPSHSPFFHPPALLLGQPAYYRTILVLTEALKTCGIPILLAVAAIAGKHAAFAGDHRGIGGIRPGFWRMNVVPALRAVTAFVLFQLSTILSPDFELSNSMSNPLVIHRAETVDTLWFRESFMNMNLGPAGALWLFQFAVQLVFTVIAYLLVRRYFVRGLFHPLAPASGQESRGPGGSIAGIAISLLYAALVLGLLYPMLEAFFHLGNHTASGPHGFFRVSAFLNYVIIYAMAVVFNLLISVTLAYPLTVKDLPGRSLYKLILLLILVIGGGTVPEYLLVRSMGMINTVFPLFLFGWFNLMNVFVLKSIFNAKFGGLKERAAAEGRGELRAFFHLFLPNIWKPLIGLGVLQFAQLWNSYMPGLIYLSNPSTFPPILQFKRLTEAGANAGINPDNPLVLVYGALVCLPSLLLFFGFRRFLTSEVFVSQVRDV